MQEGLLDHFDGHALELYVADCSKHLGDPVCVAGVPYASGAIRSTAILPVRLRRDQVESHPSVRRASLERRDQLGRFELPRSASTGSPIASPGASTASPSRGGSPITCP